MIFVITADDPDKLICLISSSVKFSIISICFIFFDISISNFVISLIVVAKYFNFFDSIVFKFDVHIIFYCAAIFNFSINATIFLKEPFNDFIFFNISFSNFFISSISDFIVDVF